MDEARFKGLVEFTRRNFMSSHQPQWAETAAETRARFYEKVLPERGRSDFLCDLVAESTSNKMAWDTVKLIAENLLRAGESLPAELREWLADVLSDIRGPKANQRCPRPTKGGSPEANRDWVFCMAVHHVGVRFNLPATRDGDVSAKCCAVGGSAVDVVGRALFGATVKGYKNSERIWANRDPILSYTNGTES